MKINVQLVTPEKLVYSQDVDSVTIPGSEGDFGVLPQHSPLMSSIRPGVVTISDGDKSQRIFVTGGFAEVTGDRCTILATESEDVSKLDAFEIEARVGKASKEAAGVESKVYAVGSSKGTSTVSGVGKAG